MKEGQNGLKAVPVFFPKQDRDQKQGGIEQNSREGMQRVKADRAPFGVVDGIGKQVIMINQHGGNQYQKNSLPPVVIKQECYEKWYGNVQGNMYEA